MDNSLIIVSAVWCPSCLLLKKELKKIESEYNLEYQLLDYDLDEEEVKQLDVGEKLPVVIYGDKRLIGEKSYDELIEFFKECNLIWEN